MSDEKLNLNKRKNQIEKILKIENTQFVTGKEDEYGYSYDGVIITTDKQEIKIGIDDSSSCCENFDFISSEDNYRNFIGSDLYSIKQSDYLLKGKDINIPDLDEGGSMFINVETSKGLLQFVCYNSHNGYYSHNAIVISRQLNLSEEL